MAFGLGIDLGGTKILAGVIDLESGHVAGRAKKRTRAEHGADDVMQRLQAVADEALGNSGVDRSQVVVAGVGAAGQVDEQHGVLIHAPNLPQGMVGAPITATLSDHFGCPVALANDVAAAAAGEATFGAGRDHPDFVCIFSGTGIGGAIYREGKPYKGNTDTAGELGHMVIDYNGRLCGCGGLGHLEAYASRSAVVRTILSAMRQGRESSLSKVDSGRDPNDVAHSGIRSKAVADAVRDGDALAIETVEAAARYMGAGLVSIVNFYNPPRIVLGGGLVQELDLFFRLAADGAMNGALQVPAKSVQIVKAALGDDSGIVGAAVLASRRIAVPSR